MVHRGSTPVALGLAVFAAGLVLYVPGLTDHGLWSEAELAVYDRARAALGEPLSGLVRSPWLPDAARSLALRMTDAPAGIRLPHALAAAGLAAIATAWARADGRSTTLSLLAGALALGFGGVAVAARTALGNPVGELMAVLVVGLGRGFPAATRRWVALARLGAFGGALVASVASSGLILGAAIPLTAIALMGVRAGDRRWVVTVGALALGSFATAVALAIGQGDGYIPLLGAAKDLGLQQSPADRRFGATLETFGYAVFPWAPLALLGAVAARARASATWLLVTLALAGGWSLVYGPTPLFVGVPAALLVVAGVDHWFLTRQRGPGRRVATTVVLGGIVVLTADAGRTVSRIVAPVHRFASEHQFPSEVLGADPELKLLAALVGLATLVGAVLGAGPGGAADASPFARFKTRWGASIVAISFTIVALTGAGLHARVWVPRLSHLLSIAGPLATWRGFVASGELPRELAVHRIRDRGLSVYGPASPTLLGGRKDIAEYLAADVPRAALIRELDYAPVYQQHRAQGWPMYLLDDAHQSVRLVANRRPAGAIDRDTIAQVLSSHPPTLAHATLLRFEDYVEVIGWELDEPIVRGRKHTVLLALKVLRPLPGGTKIYIRFLNGRLSRIGNKAEPLAQRIYPCNLWREGDYILHRHEFEAPLLEILPGSYKLVLGLRRGERNNFDITIPEAKRGEYGVEIQDSAREFAAIASVDVW